MELPYSITESLWADGEYHRKRKFKWTVDLLNEQFIEDLRSGKYAGVEMPPEPDDPRIPDVEWWTADPPDDWDRKTVPWRPGQGAPERTT